MSVVVDFMRESDTFVYTTVARMNAQLSFVTSGKGTHSRGYFTELKNKYKCFIVKKETTI